MISLSELHISEHVLSQVFIYFIFYSWWWVWQQFNQNAIFFFCPSGGDTVAKVQQQWVTCYFSYTFEKQKYLQAWVFLKTKKKQKKNRFLNIVMVFFPLEACHWWAPEFILCRKNPRNALTLLFLGFLFLKHFNARESINPDIAFLIALRMEQVYWYSTVMRHYLASFLCSKWEHQN